jgi:hypothetical protein
MTELTALILDQVAEQGFVAAAPTPVNEKLDDLARRLVALLHDWDDDVADALFADNVALDASYARRAATAHTLTDDHQLTIDEVEFESAAAATAHCTDASDRRIDVTFSLAPMLPPRIQEYDAVVKPS